MLSKQIGTMQQKLCTDMQTQYNRFFLIFIIISIIIFLLYIFYITLL